MRLAIRGAIAAAMIPAGALAIEPARGPAPPATPTLVVVIVVDQLRGDYLERFRPQLSGGLARLLREGAVFSNAHQDHAATATAAGHASVLSGRYPAGTGMVRNSAGVGDSSSPLIGATATGASPVRFRGTTMFDWMKARWPESRAFGAAGDDRNVIPVIGRARESVFWSIVGRFVTSRYYTDSLPPWVAAFNTEAAHEVSAPGRVWNLLREPAAYTEPDSIPWENRGVNFTFPHVGPPDSARAARAYRYTPWGDSLTLAFGLRGMSELGLGRGSAPDLLVLGLTSADDVGHAYGPDSREMHDYILRLDGWLGTFLDSLERLQGPRGMVAVLTSDHGVTPFPEASWARGDSVPRHVKLDTALLRWQSRLASSLGAGRYILWTTGGMVALDRNLLTARGVRMDTLLRRMGEDLRHVRGVARVQTRADLAHSADTTRDDVTRRWRRTIEPGSQVELFLTLERGSDFSSSETAQAQHGQNSILDTHVSLVLWGEGVQHGEHANRVSVVDIAPTLAHILGIQPAERLDGRVLTEALTTNGR